MFVEMTGKSLDDLGLEERILGRGQDSLPADLPLFFGLFISQQRNCLTGEPQFRGKVDPKVISSVPQHVGGSIGYGGLHPQTDEGKVFLMFFALVAIPLVGYTLRGQTN